MESNGMKWNEMERNGRRKSVTATNTTTASSITTADVDKWISAEVE